MTPEQMWQQSKIKGNYGTFTFEVDCPEKLIELTKQGIKQATTSLLEEFGFDQEPLPQKGEYYVIVNQQHEATCIVKEADIIICPFNKVTEEMAKIEGEGDKSLAYWQKVHRESFMESCQRMGITFEETMDIVFEHYELVYKG